jgi:ferritin-like metal-binding protein YciE
MKNLSDLFLEQLADIYHAERQLFKALPKMAKATSSPELKNAFESHLEETQGHAQRLERVFEVFNRPAKGKKCQAMEGLIEEAKEIMDEESVSSVMDAALIAAAQKVEHYEIATYGCLCTWAELLGNREALDLLKQNMSEEEQADKKLTEIAERTINVEAAEGREEGEAV